MGDATSDVETMFMEVLIGNTETSDASQKYKLALSTESSHLNVFSSACPDNMCDVKQKFNKSLSSTYTPSIDNQDFNLSVNSNQSGSKYELELKGEFGADDFRIRMNGFNRETVLPSLDFGSLVCSTCHPDLSYATYRSDFDGWLGIAPYDGNVTKVGNYNFLWQL